MWRITRLGRECCLTWDDAGGIRRRYRLGTSDPKEASRLAPARYAQLTRPRGKTVEDLWDGYLGDMSGRAVVGTMRYTWRALEGRFGPMHAEHITIADCRAHADARRSAGIRDGTIHTELGHLRMVLKWAEKHRLIELAPAIERPSKPEPKEGYLTRPEVSGMIDAANAPHVAVAIILLIGTGARSAAARELTWDRVDFDRRMIQLRNPFDKARRKGRATVPMNDTLAHALTAAKAVAMSQYVIEWAGNVRKRTVNIDGREEVRYSVEPVQSLKRGLKAAGAAIGRPDVSPHMLRRSAAIWMVEDGHSFEEVAQFLGHSDVKITYSTYARYSSDHLRRLASSLEV